MIVKIIQTGETVEYNDAYAARMIEQGIAVLSDKKNIKRAKSAQKEVTENVTEIADT